MKVHELIRELNKYDSEADVCTCAIYSAEEIREIMVTEAGQIVLFA